MADAATVFSAIQEVRDLKELFERIKTDTEEFIRRAKALSETGAHEAKDLVDAVKNNWQSVLAGMGGVAGLASFISGALKSDSPSSADSERQSTPTERKNASSKTGSQSTGKKSAQSPGKSARPLNTAKSKSGTRASGTRSNGTRSNVKSTGKKKAGRKPAPKKLK